MAFTDDQLKAMVRHNILSEHAAVFQEWVADMGRASRLWFWVSVVEFALLVVIGLIRAFR